LWLLVVVVAVGNKLTGLVLVAVVLAVIAQAQLNQSRLESLIRLQ